MRFIAKKIGDTELTAIIQCADIGLFNTKDEFLVRLKKAITNWIDNYPEGKEAWDHSSGDFNFGDLSSHERDINLIIELRKQDIFSFSIEIISSFEAHFSYDEVLVTDEKKG